MKIAFICDTHLPESKNSLQYAFLKRAVAKMKEDGIETVVDLGDFTSFGELSACSVTGDAFADFNYCCVLGNSEVRDEKTLDKIISQKQEPCFTIGKRTLLGINTPYADIDENDRKRLEKLKDGDIVFLHHYVNSLHKESREFFETLLARTSLTVIHGHAHKKMDYTVGKSRVFGLRALDPDKSIGDYPCVTYAHITDEEIVFEEKCFDIDRQILRDIRNYFGISCVDNERDIKYAICNNVLNMEIRCRKKGDADLAILPLIKKWRECGGKYLSVHMPDLKYKDGEFFGVDEWNKALEYAKTIGVNGLTIHPPKAKVGEMKNACVWEWFLEHYIKAVNFMGDNVCVGIENMHMAKGDKNDENRGFGFTPEEVLSWINAINERLEEPKKVGHLLDVGHARNNGIIASTNPVGRWYEKMGNKTVAYHIHQAVTKDGEMKNHCPITDWFGPMISYASFFYAWQVGMLNKVPIFLEVKGSENYDISVKAFQKNAL